MKMDIKIEIKNINNKNKKETKLGCKSLRINPDKENFKTFLRLKIKYLDT